VFLLAATLGAGLFLAAAPSAHATFEINFTTSAGTVTVMDNNPIASDGGTGDMSSKLGTIMFTRTLGGIDIGVALSVSNSPGKNSLAQLSIGGLEVDNTTNAPVTLTIRAADQGFMVGKPNLPMSLASSLVGNITEDSGKTSTITFRSFADAGNHPLPTFPFGSAFSTSPLTASVTSPDGSTEGFNLKTSYNGFSTPTLPYSLGGQLTLTLAGGASANSFSGKTEIAGSEPTTQTIPVPEPATLTLACTGLCSLVAGGWWRRRRAVAA
jgi:hypothetical protein